MSEAAEPVKRVLKRRGTCRHKWRRYSRTDAEGVKHVRVKCRHCGKVV